MNTTLTDHDSFRIDYLDLLKGFTILWIVWWHSGCPLFAQPYYHVPLFFFIAGMFCKGDMTFKESVTKAVKYSGLPFVFFYLISYPYRIIVYLWDHRTIIGFRWDCIFDIFKIESRGDYLYVNVPLWFLICLFSIYIIYYFINKMPKWSIWLLSVCCSIFSIYLDKIPTPLMLNRTLHWISFFAIGNLLSKYLISLNIYNRNRWRIIMISLTVYFITEVLSCCYNNDLYNNVIWHLLTFSFIFLIISLFSFLDNCKYLGVLRFYGKNSIIVVGLHVPVLIVYQRIAHKLWGAYGLNISLLCAFCTVITLYPLIILLNKYLPQFVGKKDLIHLDNNK